MCFGSLDGAALATRQCNLYQRRRIADFLQSTGFLVQLVMTRQQHTLGLLVDLFLYNRLQYSGTCQLKEQRLGIAKIEIPTIIKKWTRLEDVSIESCI